MRIAFIGVAHWHARQYYQPASRLGGVQIVAVSDPHSAIAEGTARHLGAKAFTDYRELLASAKPDFVFGFGRHCDMAEIVLALIEAGVAFFIEKPGGLNFVEVVKLRDGAAAKGLHASTGFTFRVSDLWKKIFSVIGDDPVTHASFRFIAGGPYRYRENGCAWMLDPQLSGGGAMINLGIHFVDMFRALCRTKPTEVVSLMGHSTWNLPIEDYCAAIMRTPQSVCTIESGYTFPGQNNIFDRRFSICTTRHYIVARCDDVVEIYRTSDGHLEKYPTATAHSSWYPFFVSETIDRFERGLAPVASLDDLANAMEVIDAIYASNRANGAPVVLPSG